MKAFQKKTNEELSAITGELVQEILAYKDLDVDSIILYGSYARGDADEESDIDVMVLCDNRDEELSKKRFDISKISSRIGLENDVMVAVLLKDHQFFDEWFDMVPFYRNVKDEGVVLYDR